MATIPRKRKGRQKRNGPRLSAEARRERIAAAAATLFSERGYSATSMGEIADAAGITKAVIYDHFPSKNDLLVALVEEHQRSLLERLGAALVGADEAGDRLRRTTEAFLAFVEERPFLFEMLVGEAAAPDASAVYARAQEAVSSAIGAMLAAEPVARPDDPDRDERLQILAQLVRVTVSGLAMWWREHREIDRDLLARVMLEFMWFGLSGLRDGRRWPD